MYRRTSLLCLILLFGAWLSGDCAFGQGQNAPRLVIDNRFPATAYVEVWVFNGNYWQWAPFVSVDRNSWRPVLNIQQGQRFRALLPDNRERLHYVTFNYDPNYGGYQSVWVIQ